LTSADNRIAIYCNFLAIFGAIASVRTYFQLAEWGLHGNYLLTYFAITATALLILVLNYLKKLIAARSVAVLLLNLTAWFALIFFGKTFNGYHLFFVAIVFSVNAFPAHHSRLRWGSLAFSLLGLYFSDFLSHAGILPITQLNSSGAPLEILLLDTTVVTVFLVAILLIENFLSERYEKNLTLLNRDLEDIVTKRTELLEATREEAMAASRAKSQFIANTSHELRTPLGAILGFVELILGTDVSDTDRRKYLEVVRRNANQLLKIVNEVLDLSKIEARKLQAEDEVCTFDEIMSDVESSMSLKAEDKGLTYVMHMGPSIPKFILIDPLRLKQILFNLIGNAIKFTDRGCIRVKVQYTSINNDRGCLQFDIEDTGPGISKSDETNLFQPFSQGDSSSMRKFGGTGLGLVLSKSLAKLLGGDLILLHSQIDVGSVFRLTVMCGHIHSKARAKIAGQDLSTKSNALNLRNMKILAVDDSPDNLLLVTHILTLNGAKVDVVENGEKALARLAANSEYHVVLMDLQMPVMDGYETTRILRERGNHIPIVAFTAHAMKDEQNKCKSAGFTGFLTKPVQRQNLIATLMEFNGKALSETRPV